MYIVHVNFCTPTPRMEVITNEIVKCLSHAHGSVIPETLYEHSDTGRAHDFLLIEI